MKKTMYFVLALIAIPALVYAGSLSGFGNLEMSGAIQANSLTVTNATDGDAVNASAVNVMFIDSTGDVTIGGFTDGVAGQMLHIAVIDTTGTTTLEYAESTGNQDIYLSAGGDEAETGYGGWTLLCNGTHWYESNRADD